MNDRLFGKILTVDDTPSNNEILEARLVSEGYEVICATSGAEALEIVDVDPPDLILLDVMMPELDGYEVCRRIRKQQGLQHVPVIFITASELLKENVIEGLDAGGNDYICRPFDHAELFSRIQANLRVKALNDELEKTKEELLRYVSRSTRTLVEGLASGETTRASRVAEVTVLFSDMRGFTELSESLSPDEAFARLNLNLGKQIEIVEKYDGIIDKLRGDEVMVVFEGENMVDSALQCAREIVAVLSSYAEQQEGKWAGVGIGINTGEVFWGDLGTMSFKDHTVIGNTVNVAARLCGLAHQFQILLTESTRVSIQDPKLRYRSIGAKLVKGFERPIEIFELIL